MLVGAAIIGFLVGLILCYWKQLKTAYDNRDTIKDFGDVATGVGAAHRLYEKL